MTKITGSTAITDVKYNKKTQQLLISFRDGTKTTYYGVPPHIYEDLKETESVGGYFNKNVRNSYPHS
jgi:hypothetical protein